MIFNKDDVAYIYIERWMLKEYKIKEGIYKVSIDSVFEDDINFSINLGGENLLACLSISEVNKRLFKSIEDLKNYRLNKYNREIERLTKKVESFSESDVLN